MNIILKKRKKMVFDEIKKIVKYLVNKVVEIKDMEPKDALLAKTVIDIHKKKVRTKFNIVPLNYLFQIHAIDRENAIKATNKRVDILIENREKLLKEKNITRKILNEYLPSVSWIKVVKEDENSYLSYEGNGRLVAMKKVFSEDDNMFVEVEEYIVSDYKKILRRMNRIRKLNKLI